MIIIQSAKLFQEISKFLRKSYFDNLTIVVKQDTLATLHYEVGIDSIPRVSRLVIGIYLNPRYTLRKAQKVAIIAEHKVGVLL